MNPDQPQVPQQPQQHAGHGGSPLRLIVTVIWAILVVVIVLLCIRFVLSLIGANPTNDFAVFIYNVTYVFVAPFQGLLQVGQSQIGVIRIEYETIVAIIIYVLLGAGITAIMSHMRR